MTQPDWPLGIWCPMPKRVPTLAQIDRLIFEDSFLSNPPPGWLVSLTVTPELEKRYGKVLNEIRYGHDPPWMMGWPEGTLVREKASQAVWRLTGTTWPKPPNGRLFEARWPD